MRRFTRTPYYTGPDDPERGQVRGALELGKTVIIETPGGADGDLYPGVVPELTTPRGSRPGGPFLIEDIEPGDWVSIEIIDMEVGPYGYYNNGGPFRGSLRSVAPVRDGLLHFSPDFVVPIKPMIGVIQLEAATGNYCASGGNMDYNSICPGSTVYIRAQKSGGYLTLGDVHARMGDGELTGTGVEIDSVITLKVDRVSGFPTNGIVVETQDAYLTSGMAGNWEEALKLAWTDMVVLVSHLYDTTPEHANLIVGTIGDAVPGYAAGTLNSRSFKNDGAYVTCQIAITKDLRRTGVPFQP
jgi:amidase